jgi:signal transduction histidine kinase/CheY-like chemotaxis protein
MTRRGIRSYVLFLAVAPATLIAIFLTIYFTATRLHGLENSLRERGFVTAQHLAVDSAYPVISGSSALLTGLVNSVARERYVRSVEVLDRQFHLLAAAGSPNASLPKVVASLGDGERIIETGDELTISEPVTHSAPNIQDPFQQTSLQSSAAPTSSVVGYAVVSFSKVETIRNRNRMLLRGFGIAAAGLVLTAGVALSFVGRVTRPIRDLSHAVEQIANGALDTRVATDSRAELLVLQRGVNKMAASLQASQINLERRIAKATAELVRKKEEAEHANIAKSRFLAAASHDLRQPMHALRLFVGALAERIRFDEVKTIVQNAEASVDAMEGLLNALLDISRLDAGVLHPEIKVFPVNTLLTSLLTEFGQQTRDKGLRFTVVRCSAFARSDPVMLRRILLNLVSNAVRYTEHGGIVVGCRRRGDILRLEVWDSGAGIPAEKHREIFQEFYQLSNPERDRNKGLGLGLAIVDRLAKLLGTRTSVRSQPGRGSVFAVEVPLVLHPPSEPDPIVPSYHSTVGKLDVFVVVVDDELTILEGMKALLNSWGCRTLTASCREEVLAKLAGQRDVPDMIISDYRLPGEDNGIKVIRAIQGQYSSSIPAVLVSGDTSPDRLKEAQSSGYELLHKPVAPLKLRLLITHMTSHSLPRPERPA